MALQPYKHALYRFYMLYSIEKNEHCSHSNSKNIRHPRTATLYTILPHLLKPYERLIRE